MMQIAQRLGRLASHGLILSVVVLGVGGAAFAEIAVPPELRGWEPWALQDHETHRCPWLVPGRPTDDARICAWPSVLDLQVDEHGGRFSQRWQVAAETWVPLPGSPENWPEEVTLDGTAAAVVAHDGRAGGAGHARSTPWPECFSWTRRPELLAPADGRRARQPVARRHARPQSATQRRRHHPRCAGRRTPGRPGRGARVPPAR